MDSRTQDSIASELKRLREQTCRYVLGDVTSTSPFEVTIDGEETSQSAIVIGTLAPVLGDRIIALKQGASPPLVIGWLE